MALEGRCGTTGRGGTVGTQGGWRIKLGGKVPVNLPIGAYYYPLRPQYGATWQLLAQVAIIL